MSSVLDQLFGAVARRAIEEQRVAGLQNSVRSAAFLDHSLTRLWQGQRIAPLGQRTLQATLDWSRGLLCEFERIVLRRLAVVVGHFTINADSLIGKLMVATNPIRAMTRYRLLDTTASSASSTRDFEGISTRLGRPPRLRRAAGWATRHRSVFATCVGRGQTLPRRASMARRKRVVGALGERRMQSSPHWLNRPTMADYGRRRLTAFLQHPAVVRGRLGPTGLSRALFERRRALFALVVSLIAYWRSFRASRLY